MNWDQVEGKWRQYKGQIREKWGELTDDDVHVISGKREELIGKIQERYGYARERAAHEVDSFVKTLKQQHNEDVHSFQRRDAKSDSWHVMDSRWYVVDSRGFREIDATRTPINGLREIYKEVRHTQ
jgi:uncharacterized protein YjbJ (UPF0337 family)